MTGEGRPDRAVVAAHGIRLGIAASRWNAHVVDAMVERAIEAARSCGVTTPTVVRVAGALELPVVALELAHHHDAVVGLAAVIRGATPHFEYVAQAATMGLTQVAIQTGTPVGDGILTCDSMAQALDRCGLPDSAEDKGWEATVAALDCALVLRDLRSRAAAGMSG
ncbi:MAG: 6,7-dimethyl-8-ribityllumazine synthase [Acidothermus cellulolyticus]|nr:6,7-dimethyl-8-ribityllumazine synthase [Acidothermus cellulolyticus]MCL6549695.1 6,7-dimethyl-8-ribityllumazine synthase [Acidothermus cellulolyticus]